VAISFPDIECFPCESLFVYFSQKGRFGKRYLPTASAMDAEYIPLSDATDYIPNEINVGDQVFWNDPDQGLSSGIYTIDAVLTENGKLLHGSDICLLKNDAGSQAEVFAHELS